MLSGLSTMGSSLLRDEASGFAQRLDAAPAAEPLSAEAHMKAARQSRMRFDGVRQRAFRRMEGWGGEGPPEPAPR